MIYLMEAALPPDSTTVRLTPAGPAAAAAPGFALDAGLPALAMVMGDVCCCCCCCCLTTSVVSEVNGIWGVLRMTSGGFGCCCCC